jgi:hypothetical protein
MNEHNIILSAGSVEALESRYALRVTARLSEASQQLPHDVSERLRIGREQAIRQARLARNAEASSAVTVSGSGPAAALGLGPLGKSSRRDSWLKLASVVPIAALVAGFMLIEHLHLKAQIEAAAEIDAALLADDVPPAAYSDPGFVEFLKVPRD